MKNLVLGALLVAAASSAACSSSTPTDAVITARWSFSNYDDATHDRPATEPCPAGFDTAEVHAKAWDPIAADYVPGGVEVIDLFNCSDKVGTTDPIDGIFLVWVKITDHSGGTTYAESKKVYLDTIDGDFDVSLPSLLVDAGFFDLRWKLVDNTTQAPLTCSGAGVSSEGVSTTAVSSSKMLIDKYTCTDSFGASGPLPADRYDITVTATGTRGDVGASPPIPDVDIVAPSQTAHLNLVKIFVP